MIDCGQCGRKLPAAFPGSRVSCSCGWATEVHVAPPPPSLGPYRASAIATGEPTIACPYCANLCPAMVRICPHCDVRLENVRCTRCFLLQSPGSFSCERCGTPLELEELLDPTDAPCPRCGTPLEAASGGGMHECPRCGGLFVPNAVMEELVERAALAGEVPDAAVSAARSSHPPEAIRYLACPLCHHSMNRQNFGKLSGVIVDVCKVHGTWFDTGELTRVIAFVATGGLERARNRERA